MLLKSQNIAGFDYSCLGRFVEHKFPQSTRFNPSPHLFVSHCFPFSLNWLLMWSLAFELTDGFKANTDTIHKNFFCVPGFAGRTWSEGILVGVSRIAVASGFNPAKLGDTIPEVMKAQELPANGQPVVEVADLIHLYDQGRWPDLPKRVLRTFEEVIAFWQGEGAKEPEVPIKLPDTPDKPVPKPNPEPEPVEEDENKQKPVKEKASWKVWLGGIVGTVSGLMFLAQWFLPGGVVQIIKAVLEVLKQIASF